MLTLQSCKFFAYNFWCTYITLNVFLKIPEFFGLVYFRRFYRCIMYKRFNSYTIGFNFQYMMCVYSPHKLPISTIQNSLIQSLETLLLISGRDFYFGPTLFEIRFQIFGFRSHCDKNLLRNGGKPQFNLRLMDFQQDYSWHNSLNELIKKIKMLTYYLKKLYNAHLTRVSNVFQQVLIKNKIL